MGGERAVLVTIDPWSGIPGSRLWSPPSAARIGGSECYRRRRPDDLGGLVFALTGNFIRCAGRANHRGAQPSGNAGGAVPGD